MRHLLLYALCLMASLQAQAQHFEFDLTQAQPRYTDATGFGYDVVASPTKGSKAPFFFSVKLFIPTTTRFNPLRPFRLNASTFFKQPSPTLNSSSNGTRSISITPKLANELEPSVTLLSALQPRTTNSLLLSLFLKLFDPTTTRSNPLNPSNRNALSPFRLLSPTNNSFRAMRRFSGITVNSFRQLEFTVRCVIVGSNCNHSLSLQIDTRFSYEEENTFDISMSSLCWNAR